jgi:Calcium binding
MSRRAKEADREERITMEIIVDAYGRDEQFMGWYYYLEEAMTFPFSGLCVVKRNSSPVKAGDMVEVLGMAAEDENSQEMFVTITWNGDDTLAIPLSQLQAPEADEKTKEALEDWHYWVDRGYEFSDN